MIIRTGFLFLIFFSAQLGNAQQIKDTIMLAPVDIFAQQNKLTQLSHIDSLSSIRVSLTSMNDQLKTYTPVFIKEYAPGGITTLAFRGTSASHTMVLFDGFPVNPAMSGQADFSTMPPYLYDRVQIIGNPESLLYHPEALGGVVSMFTNPNEETEQQLRFRLETGSFGNYGGGLHLHKKIGKFLLRGRAYYHIAENNFSYLNNSLPTRPVEKRISARFEKYGLMQELFFVDKKHIAFLKVTSVDNLNNLPASLLQPQYENNEYFENGIFRITGGYTRSQNKYFLSLKTMYSKEEWEYLNRSANIKGINTIHTYAAIADWQYVFNSKHDMKLQWFSDYQQASSPNYILLPDMQTHRLSATGNISYKKFRFQPVIYFIKKDKRNPAAGGAFIVERNLMKDKITLTVSGGRSIRYPGFNDLYWYPGGNPLLLPETSRSLSSAFELRPKKWWAMRMGATVHDVDNWVVWQPTANSSVWSPVNVKHVVSKSADFLNVLEMNILVFKVHSVFSYSYCQSLDKSEVASPTYDAQLIYVPMHNGSHLLDVSYKKLKLSFRSSYTGKRYTRVDNLSYMPAHFHHDALFSYEWKKGKVMSELFAGIYNFTGENYQIIAWQPMPRRNFRVGISVKL